MERAKYHYCWVKAAPASGEVSPAPGDLTDASETAGQEGVASGFEDTPLMSTAVFRALSSDALPAIGAHQLLVEPATATVPIRALPSEQQPAVDAQALAQVHASAVGRQSEVPQAKPLVGGGGSLSTGSASGSAGLLTDTTPIKLLVGESLPTLTLAGTTFMGAWGVENERSGGITLRFRPVRGSRADAMAWRNGPEGRAWAEDALAISLLSFVAVGDF